MKKSTLSIILAFFTFSPAAAFAQDIPVPQEENQIEAPQVEVPQIEEAHETVQSQDSEVPAIDNVEESAKTTAPETPESILSSQLIAFFTGLNEAVTAKSGDCEAMSNALRDYYDSQKTWIDSLNYATVNIDKQTIDIIHEKSIDFGKKLSSCYDQKSIPAMLRMFAGLGEEF